MNRQQGLFLSECMDDIKIAGKKSNLETQMERLMKQTDLEEQGDAPKLLKTAGVGMLHHLASSTSIPLAKIVVRSSRICGFLLKKGICTDNHWKDFRDRIGCRHVALQLIGSTKNRFT